VIHANFLGYDEQAHRRGPASAFAHWSLKGIDHAVRDICKSARRSGDRSYELLIYSDHGQETSRPFTRVHGRALEEVVEEVVACGSLAGRTVVSPRMPKVIGSTISWWRTLFVEGPGAEGGAEDLAGKIVVTALGPLGHIYLPRRLTAAELEERARGLVAAGIPMVVIGAEIGGVVLVFNRRGRWVLPRDGREVIGEGHPFHPWVIEDFTALACHRNAGDLIICGWEAGVVPMTFPNENGAHGGPGMEETHGFALLPVAGGGQAFREFRNMSWLRGLDLRRAALMLLGRNPDQ
jgi:hypothetical protein